MTDTHATTTDTQRSDEMDTDPANVIDVRGLTKHYGAAPVLRGLDLQIPAGRMVGLLGQNGCGKTTLLKILGGVLADWVGDVRIAGHRPGPASKARVSFLPDATFLGGGMRLEHAIDYYRDFFADFDEPKSRAMIAEFGLTPTMRFKEMSKGMREKAQVALCMSRRAEVFLLDEPISGIDPASRDVVLSAIVTDLPEDATVLIASHLVHDLEPVLDSVVIMRAGEVVHAGDTDDLRLERGASLDGIFKELHR